MAVLWIEDIEEVQAEDPRSGYDYLNQAFVLRGRYVRCGHPQEMNCNCFGRRHANESVPKEIEVL